MVQGQPAPGARVVDGQPSAIRRTAGALGVALLALNALDRFVTNLIIDRFGDIRVNPVMAPMIGTPSAMLVKVGICVVVLALTTRIMSPRMATGLPMAARMSAAGVLRAASFPVSVSKSPGAACRPMCLIARVARSRTDASAFLSNAVRAFCAGSAPTPSAARRSPGGAGRLGS